MGDVTAVVNTITASLPAIFGLVRELHAKANPDAPLLTNEEVEAAFNSWAAQTVAKDDAAMADIRARMANPTGTDGGS